MVKSVSTMVKKLPGTANYTQLKAWSSAVEDWVYSHMNIQPDRLGPTAVRQVARMSLEAELYTSLAEEGALGGLQGRDGPDAVWGVMMELL